VIYYLCTRQHRYALADYLASWGKEMAAQVRVVPYGALPANDDLPDGTYVFADLERLTPAQRRRLAGVRDRLAAAGARIVNHPLASLGRADLLARLRADGLNRWGAFSPTDPARPWRYPVFVREAREHTGSLSRLVHDEAELGRVLLMLEMEGFEARDLLVVEFCETADPDGLYRKFSAFLVGGRILPRHVLFSRSWMLKDVDLLDPPHREEIRAYVRENPHEAHVRELFARAGIDYGRIDYGLLGGAIQVWEINTNPIVARPPDQYPPSTLKFHEAFAAAFNEAFSRLDAPGPPGPRIPIAWGAPAAFEA
jgi:hypothetical protein